MISLNNLIPVAYYQNDKAHLFATDIWGSAIGKDAQELIASIKTLFLNDAQVAGSKLKAFFHKLGIPPPAMNAGFFIFQSNAGTYIGFRLFDSSVQIGDIKVKAPSFVPWWMTQTK